LNERTKNLKRNNKMKDKRPKEGKKIRKFERTFKF
jgi:hypothetical protein